MKKIAEIKRSNANISLGVLLVLMTTFSVSWLTLSVLRLNPITYLTPDKLPEILWLIPSVLLVFVIHELIHVAFFLLFGKGKAKIKVSRERSLGAVVMHQVNENVCYRRWQMVIILLSPLVLLTVGLLLLSSILSFSYLIFFNILLNALGSSVDIYVSYLLLTKHHSNIRINFDPQEIQMNIYSA